MQPIKIEEIREASRDLRTGQDEMFHPNRIADKPIKPHNRRMDQITRPELESRLETIEAKMDGRLARIEDSVQQIVSTATEIKQENRDIRQSVSNLKTTLIVTAIGAALTIVFGVAAFNATLQSNMLSAFSVGQQAAQDRSQQ